MAKLSKEEIGRMSGAIWMFNLIKDKGLEAAEEELKWRGLTQCPLAVSQADWKKLTDRVAENCVKSTTAMALLTLRDEFGFGHKRAVKFMKRFEEKSECLYDDYFRWNDALTAIHDELKINLTISDDVLEVEEEIRKAQ